MMKWTITTCCCLYLAALIAQPDLSRSETIAGVTVFPDSFLTHTYYHEPLNLQLGSAPHGGPDLEFTRAIYQGTRSRGDFGESFILHRLVFRVVHAKLLPLQLAEILAGLGEPACQLTAMFPHRIHTQLVVAHPSGDSASIAGRLSNADSTSFRQQIFSLTLSQADGHLIWDALEHGNSLVSLVYTFEYSNGLPDHHGSLTIAIPRNFAPQLLLSEDLNAPERLIAYPPLDIYFDGFLNQQAPNLWRRTVYVSATALGNDVTPIEARAIFSATEPDKNMVRLGFDRPVATSRPFRIRVVDTDPMGFETSSEWQLVRHWGTLDLTDFNRVLSP